MKNVMILDEYVTLIAHYKRGQIIAMSDAMADELCTTLPRFFRPEGAPLPVVVPVADALEELEPTPRKATRGYHNRI